MLKAVPIRMSSFGKRSDIVGYCAELTKALAPQGQEAAHDVRAGDGLTAAKAILAAANAGESRAMISLSMSGPRAKRARW
jgi:hypothetical protein